MSRETIPFKGFDRKRRHMKMTVIGDSGVGKSSLALRFVKGQFLEHSPATICAAFLSKTVAFEDCDVTYNIWDTAGQERYHCLVPMFYRGSDACVVVYDITNKDSFDRVKSWMKDVQRTINPNAIIALAGNKSDLENQREVSRELAETYAESGGYIFQETSAKNSSRVSDLFIELARKVLSTEDRGTDYDTRPNDTGFNSVNDVKSGRCFCS